MGELFVVADEAAVLDDPGERPFDDPAAWQDLKAFVEALRRTIWRVMCVLCLVQSIRRPA